MIVDPSTFICEECGGTFDRDPDDEAVHAEAIRNFGVRGDAPGMAIVCDGCYRAIMARLREERRLAPWAH
jgi:hypothetical protein